MTHTKESFIRRLKGNENVAEVGDLGTSVVAFEEEHRDMSAYGGLLQNTGWTVVATDWNQRAIFFSPVEEVRSE